jgi:hypothetical protein
MSPVEAKGCYRPFMAITRRSESLQSAGDHVDQNAFETKVSYGRTEVRARFGCKSFRMLERETGIEPATSSLGN